ncbi:hypothetical protein [Candidatus Enterococcus mansonii]|uniref:Uncharacterized protein n=1 Tax=Candidatus Enterococcus mansonii TaxID=1834181 RepID=A0A242CF29_9ENTE|nr:hypothetical protein [Enterococcus sp. 4G2_DIV0659]OTO08769.1 hypothetical protein A5880_001769 [Enterococcus sp. 4G2_DIV0659]
MTILDWIAVICLAAAILFFIFMCLFLVFVFRVQSKVKKLSSIRTKNKRKRKKMIFTKRKLIKKRKRNLVTAILFLVIGILAMSASAYTVFYQSTNLGETDQKAIINGYYYLSEIENQLKEIEADGESQKLDSNFNTLSARLSSFALNQADYRISSDGQSIVNRYYSSMKELGINLSAQPSRFYKDAEKLAEFKLDFEKVKKNEDAVLKKFKIDEKSLMEKK